MSAYLVAMLLFALIYVLLGFGLNLQWGHMGLVNFGHVAFFAVGAYTSALLALHGYPIVVGLAAGTLLAGLFAHLLGWATLRLKEDYLAILTLGFAEVVRLVIRNQGWTGGPNGLPGVPEFMASVPKEWRADVQALVLLAIVLVVFLLLRRLTDSPFGRVLRAIREDDEATGSIGKDVVRYKRTVLTVGSLIAGLAGGVYAHYIGYVSPDQFMSLVTFYVWVGIVLGGSSHLGAAAGTFVLMALFEGSRFLGDFGIPVDETVVAQIRYILVGLALIVLLQWKPQGLLPYRSSQSGAATRASSVDPLAAADRGEGGSDAGR